MPDTIDQIIQDLNNPNPVSTENNEPQGGTPPIDSSQAQTQIQTQTQPQSQPQTPPEDNNNKFKNPAANRAFAEMRTKNTQYERTLQNIANQMGITTEELLEKYQEDADKQAASKLGVPPDIQRRLRQLEEENQRIKEERQREHFIQGIKVLQQEGLTQNDLYEFVDQARDAGIDLMQTQLPIDAVYKALNFNKLVQRAVEQAKQDWLAEEAMKNNHSPSVTSNPSRSSGNSGITSIDQAIKDLFNEK